MMQDSIGGVNVVQILTTGGSVAALAFVVISLIRGWLRTPHEITALEKRCQEQEALLSSREGANSELASTIGEMAKVQDRTLRLLERAIDERLETRPGQQRRANVGT